MSIRGSHHRVAFPSKERVFPFFLSYLFFSMTDFLFSHTGEACSFSESLEENVDEAGAQQPW